VKIAPRSARVHYLAARAHEAIGDLPAAAEEYQQASKIAPQYGSAHYALALAYRRLGLTADSQQQMELYHSAQNGPPPEDDELLEAINALKTGAYDHLNRAQSFQDSGMNEEAAREYEAALKLNPRLLRAHVNLIITAASQGDFARAEQHYDQAIALNRNSAEAFYNYGLVLSSEQRFPDAEQAFRSAIEINPLSADAYNNLGYALQSQNKIADAEAGYRRALQNEPAHRQANFNLARLLESRGDTREAIACLLKAVAIEDDKTSVFMYYLSAAYAQNKEFERAIYYGENAKRRAIAFDQSELVTLVDRQIEELRKSAASK
jgi:superkiller protein 3